MISTQHDRTAFIGGSDVAAILGVSPWKSPFQLYQEKIGAFCEEITREKQRLFDRGHRWEPVVVEMLVDELLDRGHDVQIIDRNARYQDPEFPFLACELDLELLIDGEEHNAEIKTVSPFAAKAWGEQDTDEIPLYYAAQVMHGLMVKPRKRAIVAALIGVDDLRLHQIERDEETISAIRAKEVEFWRRVQERDAPEPTTADDVKWLYARDGGIVMEADEELVRLCEEIRQGKDIAKQCDARIETLSTRLKCAMGHASTLVYQGQRLATWKSNKDSRTTDWKAAFSTSA
ncbi:MAG: YqaJ viral recombinase family protein [Candidatus Accumulibacter sp.]|uniref:YqaJ viral recombinase family nuclease n=1 Tax=Accumulibacter sp. TaxID=2053492 RepID=UPI00258B8803|nr:YqaJ viral recombinase family protein [Accumulibacter sp.]MBK8117574.1 YqaJ viral recombinase family protein [Accumulibacter sp.]